MEIYVYSVYILFVETLLLYIFIFHTDLTFDTYKYISFVIFLIPRQICPLYNEHTQSAVKYMARGETFGALFTPGNLLPPM